MNSMKKEIEHVLFSSYLIPKYKKEVPAVFLEKSPNDQRIRKIELQCHCCISWGTLPVILSRRYFLLELKLDRNKGNLLGALNLLRRYFLGSMALIPFQKTIVQANGNVVSKDFPPSLDNCKVFSPKSSIPAYTTRIISELSYMVKKESNVVLLVCNQILASSISNCLIFIACIEKNSLKMPVRCAILPEKSLKMSKIRKFSNFLTPRSTKSRDEIIETSHILNTIADCLLSSTYMSSLLESHYLNKLIVDAQMDRYYKYQILNHSELSPIVETNESQANNNHHYAEPHNVHLDDDASMTSCCSKATSADVVTFADSEYADRTLRHVDTKSTNSPVSPENFLSVTFPNINRNITDILSNRDSTDRRVRSIEKKTRCRITLSPSYSKYNIIYHNLCIFPLDESANLVGCANMLRLLLQQLDSHCEMSVNENGGIQSLRETSTVSSQRKRLMRKMYDFSRITAPSKSLASSKTTGPTKSVKKYYKLKYQSEISQSVIPKSRHQKVILASSMRKFIRNAVQQTARHEIIEIIKLVSINISCLVYSVLDNPDFLFSASNQKDCIHTNAVIYIFSKLFKTEDDAVQLAEHFKSGNGSQDIIFSVIQRYMRGFCSSMDIADFALLTFLRSPQPIDILRNVSYNIVGSYDLSTFFRIICGITIDCLDSVLQEKAIFYEGTGIELFLGVILRHVLDENVCSTLDLSFVLQKVSLGICENYFLSFLTNCISETGFGCFRKKITKRTRSVLQRYAPQQLQPATFRKSCLSGSRSSKPMCAILESKDVSQSLRPNISLIRLRRSARTIIDSCIRLDVQVLATCLHFSEKIMLDTVVEMSLKVPYREKIIMSV